MNNQSLLDSALVYANRGWRVFPIVRGIKVPTRGSAGFYDSTTDPRIIQRWWRQNPQYNVAIACGLSGIAVLDLDHGFQTEDDVREFMAKFKMPQTYIVRSGRRPEWGLHFYFAGVMKTINVDLGRGITGQVKSAGGYVLAPPSLHASGNLYKVVGNHPLAPLPKWIRDLKPVENVRLGDKVEKIAVGAGRHNYIRQRLIECYFADVRGGALEAVGLSLYNERCEHDPVKDARIKDEIADMVDWIESHPPKFPLDHYDFVVLHKVEKADKKAMKAWNAELGYFEDSAEEAFEYLIEALQKQNVGREQVLRIIGCSPLRDKLNDEGQEDEFGR